MTATATTTTEPTAEPRTTPTARDAVAPTADLDPRTEALECNGQSCEMWVRAGQNLARIEQARRAFDE